MTIVLSGGGTGGHITPLLAVASELKKKHPRCHIVYIGEKGGKFAHLTDKQEAIDEVRSVYAGKFRRYHGESWPKRLLDIKTNLLNLRDLFLAVVGTIQSIFLLGKLKPKVVFLKGGFVGVPVGLAAALRHIPFVTHDSDALPGLANRIVAPWAAYHATAMPEEFYGYPRERTRYVGVLVGESYQPISKTQQTDYKQQLGIPARSQLLLVTGGSLGAKRMNEPFADIAEKLLEDFPKLYIVHQTGKSSPGLYENTSPRLIVLDFIKDMHRYSGAADVIVARAGANTLAELAVQGKAVVVVPNKQLTSGHQVKNAERLEEAGAAVMIKESSRKKDASALSRAVKKLLKSDAKRRELAKNLHETYPRGAARKLAMLLLEAEKHPKKKHVVKKTKKRH